MNNFLDWVWDGDTCTEMIGREAFGAGVYEEDGKYYANITHHDEIENLGPFKTGKKARHAAERRLLLLKLFEEQ